jgi:hydrogenase expression/formation protein HypC
MCLGVPLKIIHIDGAHAVGEMNGIEKKIRVDLLPALKIGDYVMVHAGFAIEIIDETMAQETLELILEVTEAANE